MKYVKKNLVGDEKIVYIAAVDWLIFIPGVIMMFVSVYAYLSLDECILYVMDALPYGYQDSRSIALVLSFLFISLFLKGAISFIKALFYKISTELAVTSKRIIYKTGIIRRNTVELTHHSTESLLLHQSVLGRIFNFGDIMIQGTGGGTTSIYNIDNPLALRNITMKLVDSNE